VGSCKECIYHLLSAAFGQCVAVPQVIDLDVFDIVTVLSIHLVVQSAAGRGLGWRFGCAWCCAWTRGLCTMCQRSPTHVFTVPLPTERIGGTSTCCMPFFALIEALILAAAAAAAAAASALSVPFAGVSTLFAIGLRLRRASDSLRAGERDLRSKRDFRGGSAWSKRDRRRGSSSPMMRSSVSLFRILWSEARSTGGDAERKEAALSNVLLRGSKLVRPPRPRRKLLRASRLTETPDPSPGRKPNSKNTTAPSQSQADSLSASL